MAGNQPEERVTTPIAYQSWRHVTFLHWQYDPAELTAVLPAGLTPHLVDGAAWVGLTPFAMQGFRLPGLPALPVVSRFAETNLRTYVVGPTGDEGIWFFSLDVSSTLMAVGPRLALGVPYRRARMGIRAGQTIRYDSRRLVDHSAHHRIVVEPGEVLGAGLSERDGALIGRWRAYTSVAGQLLQVPVQHDPWPVCRATLVELEQSITSAAGLSTPEGEPLVHYSPGVDVRLGPPRRVRHNAT